MNVSLNKYNCSKIIAIGSFCVIRNAAFCFVDLNLNEVFRNVKHIVVARTKVLALEQVKKSRPHIFTVFMLSDWTFSLVLLYHIDPNKKKNY